MKEAEPMLDLRLTHLALLSEIVSTGSLSEAAEHLGLTVASASRMLKKMQEDFDDPLFIRVWRGLTPTDTTKRMMPVVRELLERMEELEFQKHFSPEKLKGTITIGAADNALVSLLPPVIRAVSEKAPGLSFRLQPLDGRQFQRLAEGGLDFLLYPTLNHPELPAHFFAINLFRVSRSLLVDSNHPLAARYAAGEALTIESIRMYPRILIKLQDSSRGPVFDISLPELKSSQTFIELPYFLGAPYFLKGTEYTLLMPTRTARFFARQVPGLTAIPYEGEYAENFTRLIWHERSDKSIPMQWLRSMFAMHAGESNAEEPPCQQ